MAVKFEVRQGGAAGATTRNFTSQIPIAEAGGDPMFTASMQADGRAGASQYTFLVHDDAGAIPTADQTGVLLSHNLVTISENGPGYYAWLSRGRICDKDIDGGDKPWGNSRAHHVKVDDANIELRGLDLTSAWVRPAETHHARLLAAGAAFLNGSPRVDTVITVSASHLALLGPTSHVMPARTYEIGTSVVDIIDDCATTGGMRYQVVIHHSAGASHLCLMYIDENDLTTFASTLSITDTSPNLTTSFPPIWDQGPAVAETGGDNPVSHMIVRWGSAPDQVVQASNTAIRDRFGYWAATYNDSNSANATQAQARANGLLADRNDERRTHAVTIQIPANKVDLLCAGMAINIRSARGMGGQYLGTTQTRRIAKLTWELIGPDSGGVGVYLAHMLLEVPYKVALERIGLPVGPTPASSGTPTVQYAALKPGGTSNNAIIIPAGLVDSILLVLAYWDKDGLPFSATYGSAMTLVPGSTVQNGEAATAWFYLRNPPADPTGGGTMLVTSSTGLGGTWAGYFVLDNVDQTNPIAAVNTNTGTGTTTSLTISGGTTFVNAVATLVVGTADADPVVVAGQTLGWADSQNELVFAGGSGDSTPGWTLAASRPWVASGIGLNGIGPSPQAIADTGSLGTDSGQYANPDHTHAHGQLSSPSSAHDLDDIDLADAGGYYDATQGEAAFTEVAETAFTAARAFNFKQFR